MTFYRDFHTNIRDDERHDAIPDDERLACAAANLEAAALEVRRYLLSKGENARIYQARILAGYGYEYLRPSSTTTKVRNGGTGEGR